MTLHVNGQIYRLNVEPRKLLSDVIREDLGLTGVHVGCEHGVCGACTVWLDERPVRSCLLLAAQAEGHMITTVERLSERGKLTPLQEALYFAHGIQCGFCTPGILLNMTASLRDNPNPTVQ